MRYRLVIFDMDGTLTEELLDFAAIRRDIGLPEEGGILEHLARMEGEARAREAGFRFRPPACQVCPKRRRILPPIPSGVVTVPIRTNPSRA
mgnify:CR=1 FL=1